MNKQTVYSKLDLLILDLKQHQKIGGQQHVSIDYMLTMLNRTKEELGVAESPKTLDATVCTYCHRDTETIQYEQHLTLEIRLCESCNRLYEVHYEREITKIKTKSMMKKPIIFTP
ncbi:hypothetical protein PP175_28950 (plasmid) [Aneurinibacillus sp. Ricciae_BoGa-3]|uniref:hypothetical protein n=1 Tax=Aneurinibacillus sp. Ricciae_BoGa-3 TaxID=3022697 RepID=UPI002340E0AF|nr:hypothetical protein [Aneurinibacillus sp. Ricciae_BoGa-3]WCK57220.1 hypothetical protein PP175_28950 [Aneurinibacillus sp. Ricciae_BoGa-3]